MDSIAACGGSGRRGGVQQLVVGLTEDIAPQLVPTPQVFTLISKLPHLCSVSIE